MKTQKTVIFAIAAILCAACRQDPEPDSQQNPIEDGMAGMMEGAGGASGAGGSVAVGSYECSEAPTGLSCGGALCPDQSADQALLCILPCCTADDTCGLQVAVEGQAAVKCNEALDATPDPRCPDDAFVDGTTGTGCCTEQGQCGLIDPVFGLGCVERSEIVGVTLESMDCEG